MLILCPVCESKTRVSGVFEFKCTQCETKFNKPVPRGARDAGILIVCGAMAILVGAMFLGALQLEVMKELAPLLMMAGVGMIAWGGYQKFTADRSDLIAEEVENGRVVKAHKVVVLEERE